jgi:hypothetical protein
MGDEKESSWETHRIVQKADLGPDFIGALDPNSSLVCAGLTPHANGQDGAHGCGLR